LSTEERVRIEAVGKRFLAGGAAPLVAWNPTFRAHSPFARKARLAFDSMSDVVLLSRPRSLSPGGAARACRAGRIGFQSRGESRHDANRFFQIPTVEWSKSERMCRLM